MDEMKKLNHVIYPTFNSAKGLILWIGLFCILLSIGGLLCIVGAPRGIDWRALKIFVGIPFGFMNSGVKEKIRFKRLMGVLARLFNPIRFRGSCLINSDSNTDLLLPKQLEIVYSFSSRILSLMMII